MPLFHSLGIKARSLISPARRSKLRRSRVVNGLLKTFYGGTKSSPHPFAPQYQLYFDGYRNLGWSLGNLNLTEAAQMTFAAEQLARLNATCVWDVGANVGLWSVFFAGYRPALQSIVCFEPDAANRTFLQMTRDKNQLTAMQIRPVALSDEVRSATFYADGLTGATGSLEAGDNFIGAFYGMKTQQTTIEVSTIDAEISAGLPAPQFIKIDVEGHELALLQGATETLRRYRPTMILEITRNENEVGQLLEKAGYRLVCPNDGRTLSRPEFATAAIPVELRV